MRNNLAQTIQTVSDGLAKILNNRTGAIAQLIAELLLRKTDASHLYSNETTSVLKTIPLILMVALLIPGLLFSSFLVCLFYPTIIILLIAKSYKDVSDQISVFSRIPWVKKAIEECAIELISDNNENKNYNSLLIESIFIKYIINNENISGSELFNIYSEICRAHKLKPFERKKILNFLKPVSKMDKVDIANKNKIALKKYIDERKLDFDDNTLEVLRDNPDSEKDYENNLQAVKNTIEESFTIKENPHKEQIKKRNPYSHNAKPDESKNNSPNFNAKNNIEITDKNEPESIDTSEIIEIKVEELHVNEINNHENESELAEGLEDDYEMPDYDSISDFEMPPESDNKMESDIDNLLEEFENENVK